MRHPEWIRLKPDFEAFASSYLDITLTIHILENPADLKSAITRTPHHAISLWQYVGGATDELINDPSFLEWDEFGLKNAELSAYAILEGKDVETFRRIALRAGGLVPADVATGLSIEILKNVQPEPTEGKPIFACNPNPLAVWLNLVLVTLKLYQPTRFSGNRVNVDPFAASLAVFDCMLDTGNRRVEQTENDFAQRRFRVALSFPGERRPFIGAVAKSLADAGESVFYDKYFEAELAQPNLDLLLEGVYHDRSELNVVFMSSEYAEKEWCGLEMRAIRDLIKRKRAHEVMLFRFDEASVAGIFSIDGYVDVGDRTPEEVAHLIRVRLPECAEVKAGS